MQFLAVHGDRRPAPRHGRNHPVWTSLVRHDESAGSDKTAVLPGAMVAATSSLVDIVGKLLAARRHMLTEQLQVDGAWRHMLTPRADERGTLHELFRADWELSEIPLQWNLVSTRANTLRGVHVHFNHDDYLIVLSGAMHLGLHDVRPDSKTFGKSQLITLTAQRLQAAFVPRGVMHGFCFTEATTYVYGLTQCWTPEDDLGCRWNDPELGLNWPVSDPVLSSRDASAISLNELKAKLGSARTRP